MITWVFVPLGLILPDQPNRAVRTRMLRGVGGALCEGRPYPDMFFVFISICYLLDGFSNSVPSNFPCLFIPRPI
jgi:hypothetical protein